MKLMMLITSLLYSFNYYAKSSGSATNLMLTPIVGFERVQHLLPSPHMKTRLVYGALVLYKLPITTLEAEYTHGQDDAKDLVTLTTYQFKEDKATVGLRGQFQLASVLDAYLRGGAQLRQSTTTTTTIANMSTKSTTTKVNPYIGTGLIISLLQNFTLNADIVIVYVPTTNSNLSSYETRPTLGLTIMF